MGIMRRDCSNLAELLHRHSIKMMNAFGVYVYDDAQNELRLAVNAGDIRQDLAKQYQLVPLWASFSIGVECLLKAVLCKHECLDMRRNKLSERLTELRAGSANYNAAKTVLQGACQIEVYADSNPWMEKQMADAGITQLFEVNTLTLDDNICRLKRLVVDKKVISSDERWVLSNALVVLKDVPQKRRFAYILRNDNRWFLQR